MTSRNFIFGSLSIVLLLLSAVFISHNMGAQGSLQSDFTDRGIATLEADHVHGLSPSGSPSEETTCPNCGGTGQVTCWNCGGTGLVPILGGTWSGSYNATHTEPTDGWIRYSSGTLTWTISASDGSFYGDLYIDGIQVRSVETGEVMWYASCSGTVSGTFSEDRLEGTVEFYASGTVIPARYWPFTATLIGNTIEGHESDGGSSTSLSWSFTLTATAPSEETCPNCGGTGRVMCPVCEGLGTIDIQKLIERWEFAESEECSEEYREQLKNSINQAWAQIDKSGSPYTFEEFVDKFAKSNQVVSDYNRLVTLDASESFRNNAREIYGEALEEFKDPYLAVWWLALKVNEYLDYKKEEKVDGVDVNAGKHDHSETSTIINEATGDCSDHANLLIDLLRNMDPPIPANRIAIFGKTKSGEKYGHALVEAYVNGEWVTIDPTWATNSRSADTLAGDLSKFGGRYYNVMLGPVEEAYYIDPADGTKHSLIEYTTRILVYY